MDDDELWKNMEKDLRYSKLIFRNILCQKEGWEKELKSMEEVLLRIKDEDQRRDIVRIIDSLKKDLAYLNRLLAVEYPN